MNNNWRLITDLVAYVPLNKETVYLSVPDKKSYQLAVTKNIDGYFNEIHIDINEFELKFDRNFHDEDDKSICIYVKNNQLPDENAWYKVKNYSGHSISLISQLNSEKGYFKNYLFEAVFCDEIPEGVAFCCKEMVEYKGCLSEMSRRLNCELYKKTKLWVPGHRYDSIKETIYYLAKVKSRRIDKNCSEFTEKIEECPEVYLVVRNLKDTDKSISDIFKTRTIGTGPDDIQVLSNMSSMVDSGEALKDDYTKFENYLIYLLPNSITACEDKEEYGYLKYKDTKRIFDNFGYFNEPIEYRSIYLTDGVSLIELLSNSMQTMMFDCILNNWDLARYRKDINISSSKNFEENVAALSILFPTFSILDGNALKYSYYISLFKNIGVDYDGIIRLCLVNWDENHIIYDSFEDFVKYLFYTELRKPNHVSTQRINSTNYKLDVSTIADLFGSSELTNTLIELLDHSRSGFGNGVSSFNIVNIGTKKSPKEFINATVTVDDIIKFKKKKGELELPENLKIDILKNKFCSLVISFDRTGEIK